MGEESHKNEGIDPQLKKHQIVKQIILLFSALGNV